jgi:predicted NBD/HSP70 family sugar kinase
MPPSPGESAPGSTASLRTANQQRVLDVLRTVAPGTHDPDTGGRPAAFTQAELARETGLARATVSNIVRELSAAGLVDSEAGSGRRGSAVRLSPAAGVVAGVDFGHSHLAVAIGDLTGQVLAEERRNLATALEHEEALELAAELIDSMRPSGSALRHIGMGLPAPVTDDVVRTPAIFPGWRGVDAARAAAEVLGAPVDVENDANLGALAEHRCGVGRGQDSSVFVKISSGVGAGIIINNALFHGSGGTAGEIGHLTLDEQGPMCRCGSRGCLEAYTSVGAVTAMIASQYPQVGLDDIIRAADDGDVSTRRALEDAGLHLGWGLATVVNLLNPSVIVVGGDMARAGELLLEPARIGLRRHALDTVAQTPVLASALGERASLVGAVLLAAERTELLVDY